MRARTPTDIPSSLWESIMTLWWMQNGITTPAPKSTLIQAIVTDNVTNAIGQDILPLHTRTQPLVTLPAISAAIREPRTLSTRTQAPATKPVTYVMRSAIR